jgi:predicted DNA binding CopG/RHH family protein
MKDIKLDKEEKELLQAYESGEFQSDMTPSRKKYIAQVAAQTFKKDKRINIRISGRDLAALQRRALDRTSPVEET